MPMSLWSTVVTQRSRRVERAGDTLGAGYGDATVAIRLQVPTLRRLAPLDGERQNLCRGSLQTLEVVDQCREVRVRQAAERGHQHPWLDRLRVIEPRPQVLGRV